MQGSIFKPLTVRFAILLMMLAGWTLLLSGCASQQLQDKTQQTAPTTQVLAISLKADELRAGGIAFITPSSTTGQEEDKQALALAFTEVLLAM